MNRSMDDPRLVIIGAGVAGLSAGCYAARSGYRTTILEMHDLPGGLCTSWRRKGYLFDGSVAGLAGTSPEMPIYRLWQDLGVIDSCPLYDTEDFGSVLSPDGRLVTVYTDVDRLEAEFLAAFPADAAAVREFCSAVRACRRIDIPFRTGDGTARALATLRSAPASLRALPALLKYGRVTLREFTRKLTDPFCFTVFNNLVHFGGPDVPLLTVLLPLAYADRHAAGIPLHGWLSFAQAIERRFVELGGEVRYRSPVVGLTTAHGHVTGVRLATDEVVTADRVLSAADGRFTHGVLLGEPEREIDALYDSRHLSDQPVQVNLGVARDWTSGGRHLPDPRPPERRRPAAVPAHGALQTLRSGRRAARQERAHRVPRVRVRLLAGARDGPAGLRGGEASLRRPRDRRHRAASARLRRRRRGRRRLDPTTRERYTGNWMGAMQARRPDAGIVKSLLQGGPRYDHPGLAGFYLAGQWVESWGGITTAAQSGRNAVRALCKKDGARFAY